MKRREEQFSDALFGVPVSVATALNTSEPILALMRCDVPVTCGSLDRVMNIRVLWQGRLRTTRSYIINCRNAAPSVWNDPTSACVFSNENV